MVQLAVQLMIARPNFVTLEFVALGGFVIDVRLISPRIRITVAQEIVTTDIAIPLTAQLNHANQFINAPTARRFAEFLFISAHWIQQIQNPCLNLFTAETHFA
jgi:hypothetical protein